MRSTLGPVTNTSDRPVVVANGALARQCGKNRCRRITAVDSRQPDARRTQRRSRHHPLGGGDTPESNLAGGRRFSGGNRRAAPGLTPRGPERLYASEIRPGAALDRIPTTHEPMTRLGGSAATPALEQAKGRLA
jgi:hypothetical protein